MKTILTLVLAGLFACGTALAADSKDAKTADTKTAASDKAPSDAQKAQQDKMKMCNEKTKGMSKADGDKARSECMKAS